MARTRTFAALRSEALALADCGNDPHILEAYDADGTGTVDLAALWVNQGIAELWRKLVHVDPDRYVVRTTQATVVGTSAYNLPAGFMAIRRVDLIVGTNRIPIDRWELQEAPYYSQDQTLGANGYRTRYRVMGQGIAGATTQIWFDPDPGANTFAIWYVVAPILLVADGDTFDGVAGFEDWVVAYAALRMCQRQETDATPIMAEMARIESSIVATASSRDQGRAPRIADVRQRGFRR